MSMLISRLQPSIKREIKVSRHLTRCMNREQLFSSSTFDRTFLFFNLFVTNQRSTCLKVKSYIVKPSHDMKRDTEECLL